MCNKALIQCVEIHDLPATPHSVTKPECARGKCLHFHQDKAEKRGIVLITSVYNRF